MKYFFSILGGLTPVIISFLLLAAHFSRNDQFLFVLISFAALGLLFIRQVWSVRAIQALLLLGGIEWVISMLRYITERKANGEDWVRLAIILSVVALFTIVSGLVFFSKKMKAHYRIK
jgi:hypothetical protein